MLREINSLLRKFVMIFGAIALIISLVPEKKTGKKGEEIYQSKEFDDIW